MDSYFDIKALPNPEITESTVVSHLMQQLHRFLASYRGRIGLDYPGYRKPNSLGGVIRILGARLDLEAMHNALTQSLEVGGYGFVTPISAIPEDITKHARYTRVHSKGTSRLRRLKKRHQAAGTWSKELETVAAEKFSELINLPHIKLKSTSTGQQFLLFINRSVLKKPVTGSFNSYGLSHSGKATVPRF